MGEGLTLGRIGLRKGSGVTSGHGAGCGEGRGRNGVRGTRQEAQGSGSQGPWEGSAVSHEFDIPRFSPLALYLLMDTQDPFNHAHQVDPTGKR